MNVAAYVTWVALLVLLYDSGPRYLLYTRVEALICLLVFLAIFLGKQIHDDRHPASAVTWVLLALEGVAALAACVFWSPAGVSPILTIVFMADCGLMLGARALIAMVLA